MRTIDDLIALLEQEAEGADRAAEALAYRAPEMGGTVENAARHRGRAEAYRHALAQARHVKVHCD